MKNVNKQELITFGLYHCEYGYVIPLKSKNYYFRGVDTFKNVIHL